MKSTAAYINRSESRRRADVEFHVGGYQVLDKGWDRKAASLRGGRSYQRIVVALNETMRLMEEIDAAIEAGGGWPLV